MQADMQKMLQGKVLNLDRLTLVSDGQLSLLLECNINDSPWELLFTNVSYLNVSDICFPAVISGFEIIDNKDCGWGDFARYRIHDFENNAISFYCQDICVSRGKEEAFSPHNL